jgi:hypothetical protein
MGAKASHTRCSDSTTHTTARAPMLDRSYIVLLLSVGVLCCSALATATSLLVCLSLEMLKRRGVKITHSAFFLSKKLFYRRKIYIRYQLFNYSTTQLSTTSTTTTTQLLVNEVNYSLIIRKRSQLLNYSTIRKRSQLLNYSTIHYS